ILTAAGDALIAGARVAVAAIAGAGAGAAALLGGVGAAGRRHAIVGGAGVGIVAAERRSGGAGPGLSRSGAVAGAGAGPGLGVRAGGRVGQRRVLATAHRVADVAGAGVAVDAVRGGAGGTDALLAGLTPVADGRVVARGAIVDGRVHATERGVATVGGAGVAV